MRRLVVLLSVLVLLLGACSSDDGDDGDDRDGGDAASTTTDGGSAGDDATATTDAAAATDACEQGPTVDDIEAAPVAGSDSDIDVTMADGTVIRAHWFPNPGNLAGPVPTVLMGPGWSLAGDTSLERSPIFGALGIGDLHEHGYNVLTWDPRGFGASTGTATVNDPENEGADVRTLIDWVAEQPEAELDRPGDPRVGMIGVSYGGGIQLTVAGTDCRVDALVPNVAWHSLETALYRNETVKAGWASALTGAAAGADLDPHILSAADQGIGTGTLTDEDHRWFLDRGPGELVDAVRAPTLFVHGTVDTLFTLHEAFTNFAILRDNGVPTGLLLYCGGHGTCRTDPGDDSVLTERTAAWLDRYLRGDEDADVGPVVDVLDQDGVRWEGDDLPEPSGAVSATGDGGTLALTEESSAGPLVPGSTDDVLAGLVTSITPDRAAVALEVTVEASADTLALGAPHLTLTYSGTAPDGVAPTRAFAQVVDEATGFVLGNQVTPVPLELDGEEHTVEVDLEPVAHHLRPGDRLTLQLVATTPAYALPRLGGTLTVTAMTFGLPTTDALTPAA